MRSRVLNALLVVVAVAFGLNRGWEMSKPKDDVPPTPVVVKGQPPPAELKVFIVNAIPVYKSGDLKEILKLMPPVEVQALQPRGRNLPLDQLAALLDQSDQAKADIALNLAELQAIENQNPTTVEDGTRATYILNPPIGGQTQVVFVKVGKKWYKP